MRGLGLIVRALTCDFDMFLPPSLDFRWDGDGPGRAGYADPALSFELHFDTLPAELCHGLDEAACDGERCFGPIRAGRVYSV